MIELTYKGQPLLHGPTNMFRLPVGLQPGFGTFRVSSEVAETLWAGRTTAGTLTLWDKSQDEKVSINGVWLVKLAPVTADLGTNTAGIYDLYVADNRIMWMFKTHDANYNTYKASRILSGDPQKLELENLKEGDEEWTYEEIIGELGTALDIEWASTPQWPTETPRQVLCSGRQAIDPLGELLNQLAWYCVPDFLSGAITYKLEALAAPNSADVAARNALFARFAATPNTAVRVNPQVMRGSTIRVIGASELPAYTASLATASPSGGGTGETRIHAQLAEDSGTSIASTLATNAASSYDNFADWFDGKLVGLHKVPLSTAAHCVTWRATPAEVSTRVQVYRPRENPQPPPNTLYAYGHFPTPTFALPTPTGIWQVLSVTDYVSETNYTIGWDWPRAHL